MAMDRGWMVELKCLDCPTWTRRVLAWSPTMPARPLRLLSEATIQHVIRHRLVAQVLRQATGLEIHAWSGTDWLPGSSTTSSPTLPTPAGS